MLRRKSPDANPRFHTVDRMIRLHRQRHTGNTLLLEVRGKTAVRHRSCLGQEYALDSAVTQELHGHFRGEMIRVGVGEQQVVDLFKRRLPRQHPPPDLRPQIAEGMSLFSVDAVQHQGDALVFQ